MDVRNIFIIVTCFSVVYASDLYDGSGGSGDDDTTVSTTLATTTLPAVLDETVTMILYNVGNDIENLLEDLKTSVAKYVDLFCTENAGMCVPENQLEQNIQSIAFEQDTEDEMFLSTVNRLSDKKIFQGIVETLHYRILQDNITVVADQVIIISNSTNGDNLTVEYLVYATYNSEPIIVPQVTVEATLVEYKDNITQEIGVEFDFIPDEVDGGNGDSGDDGEVLEPWAISLIVVGCVAVVGGIGYYIFKKQSSKKRKRKSSAYLDNYSRPSTNTSNSNLYHAPSHAQRSSYGSASGSTSTYKYENPTYDRTNEKSGKGDYQDVDLEAASSSDDEEIRTSL